VAMQDQPATRGLLNDVLRFSCGTPLLQPSAIFLTGPRWVPSSGDSSMAGCAVSALAEEPLTSATTRLQRFPENEGALPIRYGM